MNFINKVHGTSYARHKKTAEKLNTSVPTSNVFISNLDTLFQKSANEQLSQNKMKKQKHVILESNFYAKKGSSPTSCACKRICCLVFKNVSKITEGRTEIKCDLLVKIISCKIHVK